MNVFLDAPQDFEHVCVMARTLETLGVERCYVYDPNGLIRPRYGKSRTRRIKKVSAGAFFHVAFERVEKPETFLAALPGQKVATVPDQRATSLTGFSFLPNDTLLFGSEGHGVRPELLALCENRVTIPQRGVTQSLNLAVAAGVVLFEFFRQATAHDPEHGESNDSARYKPSQASCPDPTSP